ncbi:alkaline phosphatase D family protein [Gillisia sp. CAL575]|uniref:alkaline phosphatase D family protein n=1 Tax=Gillisia sp. CAL575 TaxID=985255 RepID=UPI00039BBAF6|nr:alkaline phosphatase D family protein [Gillisia sp. CAL575]
MKNPLIIFSVISLFFAEVGFSQINFPESDPTKGYEYKEVHARVAYPSEGSNRIWIKGSATYPNVKISDTSNVIIQETTLQPPFYTSVIAVQSNIVNVEFCGYSEKCIGYGKLHPGTYNAIAKDNFSILLYGCMEPFHIAYKDDGTPITEIYEGEKNSSFQLRSLFKNVAMEQSMKFEDSVKVKQEYQHMGDKDTSLLKGAPKLIITTGDQVYVDAGYGEKMKKDIIHPLSAWETKRRPLPFNNSETHYIEYLNKLYNASYSFNEIEAAHSKLPTLSTIDDHELRDGWGSQKDEYENGKMNPILEDHYNLGKQAFLEHQLLLSNKSSEEVRDLLEENKSMEYSFEVNGKKGYVFDLRSARNINNNQVLGEKQWEDFEGWLNKLERDQEIILITSIPLTLRPLKFFEDFAKLFKPELRDDVRDGWSSKNNVAERNRLISLLVKHRMERDIKPIFVSGDVHKSALIEIWVDTHVKRNSKHDIAETMILGYEVVASGISHEFIKTGLSKSIFRLLESQNIGDGFIDFQYEGNRASLYPMVRKSIVAQNFGAIEFDENEKTKIHTFIYNQSSDQLEQHYLELDFDKKLPDDDYYEIIKKGNKEKKNFVPPIPHGVRVIKL